MYYFHGKNLQISARYLLFYTNLSHQKRAPTTFNTNPDVEITMNDKNHGIEQRPVSRNGLFDTSTNYKRSGKIIIIGLILDPVLAFLY